MFAIRAVRPASVARIVRSSSSIQVSQFSVCATRFGGNHEVKVKQGPGAAPGATPTDLNQSTGLERAEVLGKMEGKDIFDLAPLEVLVRGTKTEPTIIRSRDPVRYVGCSGVPGEHHEVQWLLIDQSHEFDRCDQCGNVYKWSAYEPDENFPSSGLHHH
ncbi:Cytochrome c oxidase subunit 4 [Linnemannia hyalina]|uniref:Cytochrome c oxidase subunit 4 n=1 Tax=Linnemannia hyalina TaxID=64524 RepID=A0A9P7XYZ7_9FUNG|nr:Cytochrome c oxidase subunit 4 [Linnemannia hyalina]